MFIGRIEMPCVMVCARQMTNGGAEVQDSKIGTLETWAGWRNAGRVARSTLESM